jgi:hypothetical protein
MGLLLHCLEADSPQARIAIMRAWIGIVLMVFSMGLALLWILKLTTVVDPMAMIAFVAMFLFAGLCLLGRKAIALEALEMFGKGLQSKAPEAKSASAESRESQITAEAIRQLLSKHK